MIYKSRLIVSLCILLCVTTFSQTRNYRDYHKNGKLAVTGKLKGYSTHLGQWKYFHDNGQVKEIRNYNENGRLVGSFKSFHKNGATKEFGNYTNGKEDGVWKQFHSNGTLYVKRTYNKGVWIGKWIYYRENGNVEKVENYKNGKRDGVWKLFFKNNQLSEITRYNNGKLNGKTEEFHSNGKVRVVKHFKNGKPYGNWLHYHDNGELNLISKHKNGKPIGDWIYYDENGTVFKIVENDKTDESSWNIQSFISTKPFELNDYVLNDSSKFYDVERLAEYIYSQNKIPILYYAADWCLPCKTIENKMRENPEIKKTLSKKFAFIKIKITDDSGTNLTLFSNKISISREIKSIPTFTKLNRKGKTYNKISGSNWINNNLSRFDEFVLILNTNKIIYHF